MQNFDLFFAFDLTIRLVVCGVLLGSLEQFSIVRHFSGNGVFSLGTVLPFHKKTPFLGVLEKHFSIILLIQAIISLAVVVIGPFAFGGNILLLLLLGICLLVKWRRQTGGDGAEQMAMIVLVAAAFAVFPNLSANRILIAVAFIAAQGALSYLTAGIAKLISSKWRSGFAIRDILSTYTHGHPLAFSWLQKYPTLSFIGCWSVILFECLFPIMIFGPEWLLIATLVIGLSFHIGCAVFMGLNSFLWSFPGVYPCIVAVVFLLKVPM